MRGGFTGWKRIIAKPFYRTFDGMKDDIHERDVKFMHEALREARAASGKGEVAVGAVAVYGDEVIARAHNVKEVTLDPTAHAEMLLIKEAARVLGSWRLYGVTVYATLEPCPMCAGAMVLARIDRLVFGAYDRKMGAVRTLYRIGDDKRLNHRIEVCGGVCEEDCAGLLSEFFTNLRNNRE